MSNERTCSKCGANLAGFITHGVCPACLLEVGLLPNRPGLSPRLRFGDYELIDEVARGGMGVVYRARQVSLNRTVAVKMVLSGALASDKALQRFRAEAEIAAGLQHPNIVRIHEVGEHEGQPFFSMDLVEGRNLAEIARQEPLPVRRAARYVKIVAEAVHYAHKRGILHRDLKPSNILIDESDQPRVTDFGLAKLLDGEPPLTISGQVSGSPSFLSPEQVAGDRHLSPSADVHGLGALLYYLLTGRPPFLAESIPATLRLVAESEPIAPRLLAPGVPRDLETICLKCLEKDPRRRYDSAHALAEDLERFIKGESPHARAVGAVGRMLRWAKRRPVTAMLVCTIAVLLVTIAVGATVSATRLKQANEEGMLKLRHAYLSQARAHRWSGRPGRRFESLEALRQASLIKPGLDLRNEAIAALALVDIGAVRSWEAEDGTFFSLSASYDNYLRAAPSGSVVLHRASDAQPLAALSDVPPLLQWASISPQSRFCVLYSGTNKTRFDLVRWSDTNTLLSLTNLTVRDCEFTFDERLLAVAGTAPMEKPKYWVDVYALSDDMNHSRFPVHTLPSIEFDRSGERMAVFGMNSAEVRIHATSTGLRVDTLPHGHGVHGASWLREDRGLVTACEDGHVYIWDLTVTNRSPVRLRHGSVVSGVHVSQDDRFVASIGWDDQLRLWDLNTRSESLRLPALGFRSFPFAASGRSMARWSAPGRVEVSQIADAREVRLIEASEDSQCQFSPDGRLLLVSDASGLSVREVELGREIGRTTHESFQSAELEWREGSIFTANKSGLRRWAVAFRTEGSSNVLELAAGPLMSDGKELRSLQTDSQGSRIAVCRDGWLEVRDTSSGRLIFSRSRQQHIPSAFMKAAISPDGQWVAGQVWEGNTYLWQVAGQDHGRLLHSNATGLAFSPEGRWFVTGSSLEYTFWDTQTWTVARRIPRPLNAGVHAMAVFDPQGKTAMLRFNDRVFGLFSADDGSELATVEAPVDARLGTGQFSVNGLLVVPCLDRNNVIAWNWPTIRRELGRMGLDWIGSDWPEARSSADVNGLRVRVGTGSFGARDPRCTGKQIDLSSHYNSTLAGFSRFTGDPENDLSALPGGLHRLAGTDFDARGAIQLVEFAKATNCIPIAQFCQRLNFLHAALFAESSGAKPDTVLGEYVVRYADGAVQSIALRNLESVADWWEKDSQRRQLGVHLVRAWHGTSRTSRDKGHETVLYKWVWTNPRPDKAISAICFRRTPQDAIPFLVALTAE